MCCLQDVRLRGQHVRMLGIKRRRYKLWGSGKGDGVSVVGSMELCERVVEVVEG